MTSEPQDRENDKHPRSGNFGRVPYGKKPIPFDPGRPVGSKWEASVSIIVAIGAVSCGVLMAIGVLTVCWWLSQWVAGQSIESESVSADRCKTGALYR